MGKPEEDLAAGIEDGGSVIVSPGTEVIAGPLAPGGRRDSVRATFVDLDQWVKAKLLQDFAGHYNRPDVFHLEVDRTGGQYRKTSMRTTRPTRT